LALLINKFQTELIIVIIISGFIGGSYKCILKIRKRRISFLISLLPRM